MAKQIQAIKAEENGDVLRLEINLDNFQIDDLEILDMSKTVVLPGGVVRPVTPMNLVLDTLDRLVVGGVRGRGFKGTQIWDILKAVNDAIGAGMNPVRNGKN